MPAANPPPSPAPRPGPAGPAHAPAPAAAGTPTTVTQHPWGARWGLRLARAFAPQLATVGGVLFLGWGALDVGLAECGALAGLLVAACVLQARLMPGRIAFLALHGFGFLAGVGFATVALLSPGTTYDAERGFDLSGASIDWSQLALVAAVPFAVAFAVGFVRLRHRPDGPMQGVAMYYVRLLPYFILLTILVGRPPDLAGPILLAGIVAIDVLAELVPWDRIRTGREPASPAPP